MKLTFRSPFQRLLSIWPPVQLSSMRSLRGLCERQERLQGLSQCQHARLQLETPEGRQERLQDFSQCQHARLQLETPEGRQERLQGLSQCQHGRLQLETPEGRQERLQRWSGRLQLKESLNINAGYSWRLQLTDTYYRGGTIHNSYTGVEQVSVTLTTLHHLLQQFSMELCLHNLSFGKHSEPTTYS